MKGLWNIFVIEWRAFVRSGAMLMLMLLSLAWMFAAPHIFRTDGTFEGARELCVRFSLGGVAAMLAVALVITAAGSLSRERKARRLQLTMVRPVGFFAIAFGRIAALTLAGAAVLAVASVVELSRQNLSRPCFGVYRPVLPSPREEAESMYDAYMADPETPAAVKKAKKSVVMRLLTQRAIDHYQTIPTNSVASWRFNCRPASATASPSTHSLRLRFTNLYEMRDVVCGRLSSSFGDSASISNITQAIITVPLLKSPSAPIAAESTTVSFANSGSRAVMLRPRKDVEFLVRADGFFANLVRAYLELLAMLAVLIAFGVFLGSALSRPVAVFVAVVTLALSEMSPSVIEQYPDELETDRLDAIGLSLARFSAAVTHPVGSLSPLSMLAVDDRIEPRDVARVVLTDAVVLPLLFALLSAVVLPRKKED